MSGEIDALLEITSITARIDEAASKVGRSDQSPQIAAWLVEAQRLNANLEALRIALARLERALEPVADIRDMLADTLPGWRVLRR